jgi:hypothetical protein
VRLCLYLIGRRTKCSKRDSESRTSCGRNGGSDGFLIFDSMDTLCNRLSNCRFFFHVPTPPHRVRCCSSIYFRKMLKLFQSNYIRWTQYTGNKPHPICQLSPLIKFPIFSELISSSSQATLI